MPAQSDSESEEEAHLALNDWNDWFGTVDVDVNPSDYDDDIMEDT